ncbi:MAG TPA: YetF domain-containing protein [Gemmatimonadaceae bacterium]|nr:YetF domain-containing protein [Gemmatimonadaceae bacterium]
MSFILRCALVYFFLLVVFRVAGKRALADITTFDIVLLLIISEATQQALTVDDSSLTNAFLLIATFIGIEMLLTFFTLRSPWLDRLLNSRPLAIIKGGRILEEQMKSSGVNVEEVVSSARQMHGIADLEQIDHAVLECNGEISVIPRPGAKTG